MTAPRHRLNEDGDTNLTFFSLIYPFSLYQSDSVFLSQCVFDYAVYILVFQDFLFYYLCDLRLYGESARYIRLGCLGCVATRYIYVRQHCHFFERMGIPDG